MSIYRNNDLKTQSVTTIISSTNLISSINNNFSYFNNNNQININFFNISKENKKTKKFKSLENNWNQIFFKKDRNLLKSIKFTNLKENSFWNKDLFNSNLKNNNLKCKNIQLLEYYKEIIKNMVNYKKKLDKNWISNDLLFKFYNKLIVSNDELNFSSLFNSYSNLYNSKQNLKIINIDNAIDLNYFEFKIKNNEMLDNYEIETLLNIFFSEFETVDYLLNFIKSKRLSSKNNLNPGLLDFYKYSNQNNVNKQNYVSNLRNRQMSNKDSQSFKKILKEEIKKYHELLNLYNKN